MAQQTTDVFNRTQQNGMAESGLVTRALREPSPEARAWATVNRITGAQYDWPIDPDTNDYSH